MKSVKIAPSADEIQRDANVFSFEFDGRHVKWVILEDCSNMDEDTDIKLRSWLSTAYAMSDRFWQIPFLLNTNLPFKSDIYVDGKKIDYPEIKK